MSLLSFFQSGQPPVIGQVAFKHFSLLAVECFNELNVLTASSAVFFVAVRGFNLKWHFLRSAIK